METTNFHAKEDEKTQSDNSLLEARECMYARKNGAIERARERVSFSTWFASFEIKVY